MGLPQINLRRKPRLLIDLDSVVFDYYGLFVKLLKEKFPEVEVVPREQMTDFYIENVYKSLTKEQVLSITQSKGFFAALEPIEGAVEALTKLMEEDEFELFLCSSPDNDSEGFSCHSEKAESVHRHLGRKWLDRLILTKDKTMVLGDYLIDDKPRIKGINPDTSWTHIIFDQAYNKDTLHIFRLKNWAAWEEMKNTLLDAHYMYEGYNESAFG